MTGQGVDEVEDEVEVEPESDARFFAGGWCEVWRPEASSPVIIASQVGRFVAALVPGPADSGVHSAWARRGGLRLRISIVRL